MAFVCCWLFESCAEPETSEEMATSGPTTTLGSENIGDGSNGLVDKYFYDFDDAINATFFMYGGSRFEYTYD